MDSTSGAPAEPVIERWVYGGSRVGTKDQRIGAWWIPLERDELWFKLKGSYAVGGAYDVRVSRVDGRTTMHGAPQFVGRHDDEALRGRLEAQHRAAEVYLQQRAVERRIGRQSYVDEAIDHLIAVTRNVPSNQRTGLIAYILRRLVAGAGI